MCLRDKCLLYKRLGLILHILKEDPSLLAPPCRRWRGCLGNSSISICFTNGSNCNSGVSHSWQRRIVENEFDLVFFCFFFLNERNVFISAWHFYCGLGGTAEFCLMVNLLKEAVEIERWAFSTQISVTACCFFRKCMLLIMIYAAPGIHCIPRQHFQSELSCMQYH